MSGNYELPGGRIALRKFRDRVFSSFGILPREDRACIKKPNRRLKATIFDNKRYSPEERLSIMDIVNQSTEFSNVDVEFVDWKVLKTTRDQLQKVADTDI